MTPEWWEIVAVVISSLFFVSVCGILLWWLFRPQPEPDGYQSKQVRKNLFKVPR